MKLFKKAKEEGLSLRVTFILILVMSISISVALIISAYGTIQSFHALSHATDVYITLQEEASSLLSASEYLTEEAQCYTVLGAREHMENYFNEVNKVRRREKAVARMEESIPGSDALVELKGALRESNALMETETYAMRLFLSAEGEQVPKDLEQVTLLEEDLLLSGEERKEKAERLMHDKGYYDQKQVIRSHLNNCIEELKNTTYGTQGKTEQELLHDLIWITILILLQSLGIVFMLGLTTKLGINPLIRAVEHINKDQSLPIMGAYEFRYLANAYNKMYAAYKKSVENLSFKASHDKLTGVYNRAGYDLIKQSVDLKSTAFMLFDADQFKQVNDCNGHDVGDQVLQKIAKTLLCYFRSDDYVCRIGGDEFVVMMIHVDKTSEALIERKVKEVNKALSDTRDGLPALSVSVGISLCQDTGNVQQVFHEADTALYFVKDHGRNGCCFYTKDMSGIRQEKEQQVPERVGEALAK